MSKSSFEEGRTTRLTGIAALEHASRTGAPIRRRWSWLSVGGEIALEDAFRLARDSSPDELYADVPDDVVLLEESDALSELLADEDR